jgi:hypothetical protein
LTVRSRPCPARCRSPRSARTPPTRSASGSFAGGCCTTRWRCRRRPRRA